MNEAITEIIIPLSQSEKDVLGLTPEDGEFTLTQAGLVVELAQQRRRDYVGDAEIPGNVRPEDFFHCYSLPIEQRIGAAMTTAVIRKISEMALVNNAYRMDFQSVPEER